MQSFDTPLQPGPAFGYAPGEHFGEQRLRRVDDELLRAADDLVVLRCDLVELAAADIGEVALDERHVVLVGDRALPACSFVVGNQNSATVLFAFCMTVPLWYVTLPTLFGLAPGTPAADGGGAMCAFVARATRRGPDLRCGADARGREADRRGRDHDAARPPVAHSCSSRP